MNIDKLYWKSIYYWIKYFNYKLEHTDKNTNEIWLFNKKKEELIVSVSYTHLTLPTNREV